MDYDLPAEHALLRKTIQDFCAREVEDEIEAHERDHRFPTDVVAMLGPMGLLGVPIPENEGGAGLDTLAYAITVEEFARVWGSLALIVAAHTSLGCGPLHLAGSDEQKDRWLVPMAQGHVLGAYGLTEPDAGSDSGGTRTTAKQDGGDWVINGRKRFITNAGQAGGHVLRHGTDWRSPGRLAGDQRVHRARRHPWLLGRSHRAEDGAPLERDRRAAVRGLPRPGVTDAGCARRRLEDLPGDPR